MNLKIPGAAAEKEDQRNHALVFIVSDCEVIETTPLPEGY
jgi:hypothetical protein